MTASTGSRPRIGVVPRSALSRARLGAFVRVRWQPLLLVLVIGTVGLHFVREAAWISPDLSTDQLNIATFALGRREATRGSDAASLVRVDGDVAESILEPIRAIGAITEAKLVHLGKS